MKRFLSMVIAVSIVFTLVVSMPVSAAEDKLPRYQERTRQMEKLSRGLIAIKTSSAPSNGIGAGVYLSWRLLGDEDLTSQRYDIYRNNTKIYTTGKTEATNYLDAGGNTGDVYKVVRMGESPANEEGVKVWSEHAHFARGSLVNNGTSRPNAFSYIDIPLVRPDNVTNGGGGTSGYYISGDKEGGANDASVGDLDGDGDYEIVLKWDPWDSKDAASGGYTGNVFIDAYEMTSDNGGYMWRIDLGKNIRAGAHTTQFMVYDFDGDGKSEIAMKTAPGSIDGTGRFVTEAGDTEEIRNADNYAVHLSGKGIPTSGGEYVTIFDGETGQALYTTEGITRDAVSSWGDSNWNRSERYLAAVAYVDGVHPHYIECRGYYAASVIRAWKWDGNRLSLTWEHKATDNNSSTMYGQGNHNLSVADVDNDGCDEIIYGSATLDHDGKTVLGNTRQGHGDAMHTSDFNNDGKQETFSVKEEKKTEELRNPATGEILYRLTGGADNGRGVMANIDDEYAKTHPDALSLGWSVNFTVAHDLKGADTVGKPSTNSRMMTNHLVYWDGDLSREILDDNQLGKYDATNGWTIRFYDDGRGYIPGSSNNGTKQNPSLTADVWGDWREEIIMPVGKGEGETPCLRVMTTAIPTTYRLTTLMHDCQYRLGIAWQNVAYNQPPHTSYYIGSASLAVKGGVTQNYLAPAVKFTSVEYAVGVPVEGMELLNKELTLKQGQTKSITPRFYPENATKRGIIWESDDEKVAVVSGGKVTGVGEGECIITATTRDGGFVDTARVRVAAVETVNVLDDNSFTSNSDSFTGGRDNATLTLTDGEPSAFYRELTPYHKNKVNLSFYFNTGGQKIADEAWNWDGHEYTFGLQFEDSLGNNILNVLQSYKTSAQSTGCYINEGGWENIKQTWTAYGTGAQNPMDRSSTTWLVEMELDYDRDICNVMISNTDKDNGYSKSFPLNGKRLARLKYWTTKDGAGGIYVRPNLTNLVYTLTREKAEAWVEYVEGEKNTVKYLSCGQDSGAAYLIGAAYDKNGALSFVEGKDIVLPEVPEYDNFVFTRRVEGYKIGLFIWDGVNSLIPVGTNDDSVGVAGKFAPVSFSATAEPEEANPAKNVFDGNMNTVWASAGVQSVTADLGDVKVLHKIKLAFIKYKDSRTIPFKIEVSEDESNWELVYSSNSVPLSGDFLTIYPNDKAGRYVRLTVFGNTVSGWSSVSEMEIY